MTGPADSPQDAALSARLLSRLRQYDGPPLTIMEVCGTHTVAIARMGLRSLLPEGIRLLAGPGCPVCVTPESVFDEAIALASECGATLATYGDALRVPGSRSSLAEARAHGADVRVVYSATDALELARRTPDRPVVLLGLGFETTAPSVAWTLREAKDRGVSNFLVLSAHKALLPAMHALLRSPEVHIDAFLCPGHASMILGAKAYRPLAEEYGVSCAVAGFEPNDVLAGLLRIVRQRETGRVGVDNTYPRAVAEDGNPRALQILDEVFARADTRWRGLGLVADSGYDLAPAFRTHDARACLLAGRVFASGEPEGCRCSDVLRGALDPAGCPWFGVRCTPDSPVGACMVSSEGACGAAHRYRAA